MRELKFRVWDGYNMVYLGEIYMTGKGGWEDGSGYLRTDEKDGFQHHEWANCGTIMQYTGLKDKNGVEIYEGDIVKYKPYSNFEYYDEFYIDKVKWGETGDSDDYSHSKHLEWVVGEDSLADVADGRHDGFDCEVIGNIYENHNLLK